MRINDLINHIQRSYVTEIALVFSMIISIRGNWFRMMAAHSNPAATQKSLETAIQNALFLASTCRNFADLIVGGVAYIPAHATRHGQQDRVLQRDL